MRRLYRPAPRGGTAPRETAGTAISSGHPLQERDHLASEIALGGRREWRCLRLIPAFRERASGGQITEPPIGVAEVERLRKRRVAANVHRNFGEQLDWRRPDDGVVDPQHA